MSDEPSISANYSDGWTAASRPVALTLNETELAITTPDGTGIDRWPLAALHSIDPWPVDGGPLRLASETAPGARLAIFEPAIRDRLLRAVPTATRPPRRPLPPALFHLTVLSLVLVAVALGLYAAAPLYAGPLAARIPIAWEARFGSQLSSAVRDLAGWRQCRAPYGSAALARLVRRLTVHLDTDYPIEVRVVDDEMVNAFALPGGHILVLRGLIDQAGSVEEVAGVLAHEIGHVVQRHSMVALLRANARAILIESVLGGTTTVAQKLATAGNLFLELRHSREAEMEADRVAVELLRRAGLSTAGLKRFFQRNSLKPRTVWRRSSRQLLNYLATHPAMGARAAAVPKLAGAPGLSEQDWRALQRICDSL